MHACVAGRPEKNYNGWIATARPGGAPRERKKEKRDMHGRVTGQKTTSHRFFFEHNHMHRCNELPSSALGDKTAETKWALWAFPALPHGPHGLSPPEPNPPPSVPVPTSTDSMFFFETYILHPLFLEYPFFLVINCI